MASLNALVKQRADLDIKIRDAFMKKHPVGSKVCWYHGVHLQYGTVQSHKDWGDAALRATNDKTGKVKRLTPYDLTTGFESMREYVLRQRERQQGADRG